MYWAGTESGVFHGRMTGGPHTSCRQPVSGETRGDSSPVRFSPGLNHGAVQKACVRLPVGVRGRLYTWTHMAPLKDALVVGARSAATRAFACNVEVRLRFLLAVAARQPIPSLALPDLLDRLIDLRDFGVGQMDLAGIPVGTAKVSVGESASVPYPCGYDPIRR